MNEQLESKNHSMNMNEQKHKLTFIDIENWLSYYKIRHSIITNSKTRDIIILIRLNSFNTMCINCNANVRRPEDVVLDSVLVSGNNIYDMESRYSDKPDYTLYRYDMSMGYTQTASSFFACAVVSAMSL